MQDAEKDYRIREDKNNIMTIKELQEYYDSKKTTNSTAKINWLNMIQSVFKDLNISIDDSELVLVCAKTALHELAHLLDATPHRVIDNII
ncbi:unnamed protein product [Lasius platythorax]|uniref:Uncharacterized protein n=1 Tax=Lasius platythorax TaxID=488582 RepID=A0AAV2NHU0_9HYME